MTLYTCGKSQVSSETAITTQWEECSCHGEMNGIRQIQKRRAWEVGEDEGLIVYSMLLLLASLGKHLFMASRTNGVWVGGGGTLTSVGRREDALHAN